MLNAKATDFIAVMANIDPDAYTAATYTSGWVDMAKVDQIIAIVQAGTLGTSATLDAKLEQATDGSGTGAKDVTGKAITQLTQAGSDSDKQALIQCSAMDLDIANDFDHVRLSITVGTATSDAGGIIIGVSGGYMPIVDATTVDEIK